MLLEKLTQHHVPDLENDSFVVESHKERWIETLFLLNCTLVSILVISIIIFSQKKISIEMTYGAF